ncbi:MAG: Smr/MutS family protein, partial [Firmicutes bacterium]|nr:Smr/MutS family protein [Bacillota bacterium]
LEARGGLYGLELAAGDLLAGADKRGAGRGALGGGEAGGAVGVGGEAAEAALPGGPAGPGAGRGAGEAPSAADVKVGKVFWVAGLGHFGEVSEPPDEGGMVGLLVGSMRLTVHLGDLRVPGRGGVPDTGLSRTGGAGRTGPGRIEAGGRGAGAALAGSDTALEKALTVSPEISLRGLTVEEALSRLEKYLDDALLAGLGTVRVIHGKGTGALRQAVRDFLDEHPEVRGHYLAEQSEGGLGATVVLLKTQRP